MLKKAWQDPGLVAPWRSGKKKGTGSKLATCLSLFSCQVFPGRIRLSYRLQAAETSLDSPCRLKGELGAGLARFFGKLAAFLSFSCEGRLNLCRVGMGELGTISFFSLPATHSKPEALIDLWGPTSHVGANSPALFVSQEITAMSRARSEPVFQGRRRRHG
jgi:hypothetical protein